MTINTPDIKRLLTLIEQQLDWGDALTWQSRDFENLNQLIFDKTRVSLSASTLRRVWGRVAYKNLPSGTTLDTLAKFAGYDNWRIFVKLSGDTEHLNKQNHQYVKPKIKSKLWVKIAISAFVIAAGFIIIYIKKSVSLINPNNYQFSSLRLTEAIPNSVIFNYDAASSPTDSIYIQQSWDPRTKTLVNKSLHRHTSVYYEPGFYQAKLVIGNKVIKEHKLMIPTNGWLGLIEDKPVPVYLNTSDFVGKNMLNLSVATIRKKNMSMLPKPTLTKYYNIGNFDPVPVTDFSFTTKVKNEYREGEAACQLTTVSLITDSAPIIIPLSVKGCVSELNMISINWIISGKTNDLSGFGVDFSDWVTVSCKSTAKNIQYYVNNKLAYESPLPTYKVKIVGMAFSFQGTGEVKNIELKQSGKMVYSGF